MRAPARAEDELIDLTIRVPRRIVERSIAETHRAMLESDEDRTALARLLLASRRRQRSLLAGMVLGEAGGDMVLDLYLIARSGKRVDVSGLCVASGAPPTTALRQLDALVAAQYICREPDPDDRRRTWLAMTPALAAAVEQWLDLQLAAFRRRDWAMRGSAGS